MALSGRRVGLIVALVVVALGGLVWLQVALLSYAMEIKEQTFRNSVMTALAQVSQSLSTGEVMSLALDAEHDAHGSNMRVMAVVSQDGNQTEERVWSEESYSTSATETPLIRFDDSALYYTVMTPQHVEVSISSVEAEFDSVLAPQHCQDFTLVHFEGHVVHCPNAAEVDRQIFDLQWQRRGHRSRSVLR